MTRNANMAVSDEELAATLNKAAASFTGIMRSNIILAATRLRETGAGTTAWLVELRGKNPLWWSLSLYDEDGQGWGGINTALRFARKEDAEAYILNAGWTEAFPSEHMWVDPRPVTLAQPQADEVTEAEDGGEVWPSLDEAYEAAVNAATMFSDASHGEETNWTGWGDGDVPPYAEMRRVKADQAVAALRDADPHRFAALQAKSQPQGGE